MGTNLVTSTARRRETPGLGAELGDCVRSLIDGLCDSYRPELHYMRGPGPKWHAKHGVRIGEAIFVDPRRRGSMAASARRGGTLRDRAANSKRTAPRLHILALIVAVLINPATMAGAETSSCGRSTDLAAARIRWAATRQSRMDPAHNEQICRAYSMHFYEAVMARQAAAGCGEGINRQRDLDVLDSEIDTFNHLIATRCSS